MAKHFTEESRAKSNANLIYIKGNDDPYSVERRKKAVETRRRNSEERRKMKDELDVLLKMALKRGDIVEPEDVLSMEEAEKLNVSAQTAIAIAMLKRAMMGDVQAGQFIRDTVGEKPSDKVEVDQSLTIESWAKSHNVKL